MTTRIKLVCFDLGGVVIRLCRSWQEGCDAAGIAVRNPDLWRRTRPDRRVLVEQYQIGLIDGPTFASRASALADGLYSPTEILGVHHAWLRDEYEGIGVLVDSLHRAGLDTACLSNTNHEHWVRMGEFPAVMRLRHRLASHQLGLHKPDPAIYHRLEQQLGYRGTEIIFFDDMPANVDAALAIGWVGRVIDPLADPAAQINSTLRDHGIA